MRSWYRAHSFLREVFFGEPAAVSEHPTVNGTRVVPVPYEDVDGTQLQGYVSLPSSDVWQTPDPIVIILP